MAVGTPGNDTIAALTDFEVVLGLSGDDTLSSSGLISVLLSGASGDDLLSQDVLGVTTAASGFTQLGGGGEDTLNLTTSVMDFVSGPGFTAYLDGGADNDTINADLDSAISDITALGGGGDDLIGIEAGPILPNDSKQRIYADGASGNDTILASAFDEFNGAGTQIDIELKGGGGNDSLKASAGAGSNFATSLEIDLDGGSGNDTLDASLGGRTNNTLMPGDVTLNGRSGDDVIINNMVSDFGDDFVDFDALISGGLGNDTITNDISAEILQEVVVNSRIFGNDGADVIDTKVLADAAIGFGSTYDVLNAASGGTGDDTIRGTLEAGTPGTGDVVNELSGQGGDDVIIGEIIGFGRNILSGGTGNDLVQALGGNGINSVSGDGGDDTLMGGNATDDLNGGSGADVLHASGTGAAATEFWNGGGGPDTFVFNPTSQQDNVLILDWANAFDILQFTGLIDAGAPGLADDIDAISTIVDSGPGGNVELTLTVGTTITFSGVGTGAVSSVADLVADPLVQLIA